MEEVDEVLGLGPTYMIFESPGCLWKKLPRLISSLLEATAAAPDGGPRTRSRVAEQFEGTINHRECGTLAAYLRSGGR
jgi:hypothetical protein